MVLCRHMWMGRLPFLFMKGKLVLENSMVSKLRGMSNNYFSQILAYDFIRTLILGQNFLLFSNLFEFYGQG